MTHFFDTNILIYSISGDPVDSAKQNLAARLLDEVDGALSVQVLQEFYVQATRPTRPHRLSHATATGMVEAWCRFAVQPLTVSVMRSALMITERYVLSYWDSAIVAAARVLGCETLYSEDMNHGQVIEGVRIVNPFR